MAADTVMVRLDTLPETVVNAIYAAAEAPNLPAVSSTDNGKVLKVVSGKWKAGNETVELPAVTGDDDGKVLMVVNGAWAVASLSQEEQEPVS